MVPFFNLFIERPSENTAWHITLESSQNLHTYAKAMLFARWQQHLRFQRFPLCPIESNGNKNFKVIHNPGFFPDHPQNWITGSFCHSQLSHKISERSVPNFLSYLANTQTDRQTDKQTKSSKNITFLAEVTREINDIRVFSVKHWKEDEGSGNQKHQMASQVTKIRMSSKLQFPGRWSCKFRIKETMAAQNFNFAPKFNENRDSQPQMWHFQIKTISK